MSNTNSKTKQLTVTALMLAICIASQFFKNASVFFTGSVVNLCLILTTLYCGLGFGTMLAVITPVTAFLITGAPIIAACPLIMPCIMIGNEVIVLFTWSARNKKPQKIVLPICLAAGSLIKTVVMAGLIIGVVIPIFGTALKEPQILAARTAYSTTQLITALIGSVLAYLIWQVLQVAIRKDHI